MSEEIESKVFIKNLRMKHELVSIGCRMDTLAKQFIEIKTYGDDEKEYSIKELIKFEKKLEDLRWKMKCGINYIRDVKKTFAVPFPAGKYYVGDLCYVLDDNDWRNEDGIMNTALSLSTNNGGYPYKGHVVANFHTYYGDGTYPDQFGNDYSVDSGTIGIIPIELITKPEGLNHSFPLGIVWKFKEEFTASIENGRITIGHVIINTKDWEFDEDI